MTQPTNPISKSIAERIQAKDMSPIQRKSQTFRESLERRKDEFGKALVGRMDPAFFIRVLITATAKNPKLLECTEASIVEAALNVAQLGLVPNTPLGECYLVPFKDRCEIVIGAPGYVKQAYRTGLISGLICETWCEGDVFKFNRAIGEVEEHDTSGRLIGEDGNPKQVLGAYARVKLTNGQYSPVLLLDRWELARVMKFVAQRSGGKHHYSDDYPDRFAMNSVTKRFIRTRLPMNEAMQQMVMLDREMKDDAAFETFDTEATVAPAPALDDGLVKLRRTPAAEVAEREPDGTTIDAGTGEILDGPIDDAPPVGEKVPPKQTAPAPASTKAKSKTALLRLITEMRMTEKTAVAELAVIGIQTETLQGLEEEQYASALAHFSRLHNAASYKGSK